MKISEKNIWIINICFPPENIDYILKLQFYNKCNSSYYNDNIPQS